MTILRSPSDRQACCNTSELPLPSSCSVFCKCVLLRIGPEIKREKLLTIHNMYGFFGFWKWTGIPWPKGQLISKASCQAVILPKNKQMNSFLLVCDEFLFLFWKKLKTPKKHFEIIWPLGLCNFGSYREPK